MGSGGAGELITPVAVPAPPQQQQQPDELLEHRDEGFLAHELIDLLAADDNDGLMVLAPSSEKEVLTAPHAMMLPVAGADPVHLSSAVTTTTTASSSSSSSSSSNAAAAATVAAAASGTATAAATGKRSKSTKGTSSQTQLGETGRENTGRWTCEEHMLFLKGLELHGKGWKKIAKLIRTRTVVQIRTHAQKYFQKLAKQKKSGHHGDMLGMDGGRFGKRVKFTGKRRGLVYGSYLVGVEATSAAISPALQPFMQQEEQEQGTWAAAAATAAVATDGGDASALLDKEEDAAIERGLYRFLSPVVLDPQAVGALDAAEPELVPPSTPPGVKAEDAMDMDSAGSELGTVVGGVGAEADAADDASTTTGGGGPADPLPVLAKVDAALYAKAGVPEWFCKGGDIEALLTEAAAVDWLAEAGCGGAGGLAAKGAAVLARNIEAHSNCSSMTAAATAISGVTTVAAGQGQQPKQQGVKADAGGVESAPAGMMPTTAPALLAVAAVPAPAKPAPKRKTSNGGGNKGGAGARAAVANANAVVIGAAGNGKAAGATSQGAGAPRKPRVPKQTKKQQAAAAAAEAAAAAVVAAAAATLATDEHDLAHDFDVAFGHHDDDHDNGLGALGGPLKEEEMDVHSYVHLDAHHPTANTTHAVLPPVVALQEGHPPQEHAEEHHHHDVLLDDELSHIVFHSGGEGLLLLDDLAEDDDDHGIEF